MHERVGMRGCVYETTYTQSSSSSPVLVFSPFSLAILVVFLSLLNAVSCPALQPSQSNEHDNPDTPSVPQSPHSNIVASNTLFDGQVFHVLFVVFVLKKGSTFLSEIATNNDINIHVPMLAF